MSFLLSCSDLPLELFLSSLLCVKIYFKYYNIMVAVVMYMQMEKQNVRGGI